MSTSTMTTKGQVTIPIEIREAMNIHSGDVLEFFVESDGRMSVLVQTKDVRDLKKLLPKPKKKLSIEEMNALIAKKRGEKE